MNDDVAKTYVWGKLTYLKIPVERFDRVSWLGDGWYAPDFWLPLYNLAIEVKGQPDEDDAVRWAKYRSFRGPLVVLGHEQMRHFHEISDKGDLMELLATFAAYQADGGQFS